MDLITKNYVLLRGDRRVITETYPFGLSNGIYKLTCKAYRENPYEALIEDRIIEIVGVRTGNTLTFDISPEQTASLLENTYQYDICNTTIDKTIQKGFIFFEYDVRTPFDGIILPGNTKRVISVDARNANEYEMIIVKNIGGEKQFTWISLGELKNLLNSL